jgi:hypothetical protein
MRTNGVRIFLSAGYEQCFMAASTEYDRGYVHIVAELIYLLIMGNHIGEIWGRRFIASGRGVVRSMALGSRHAKNGRLLMGRYKMPCGLRIVVCNGRDV